ncbi:hypothetical protein [Streptomyces sp. NPDC002908]|uniref:hypothetical protein n=1 Tax=Streptomyces sp. NPDC002908 TaxID=3364670 RepID=UPI0036CBD162
MINDVDTIDWSSMSHAYGAAVDVPVWLRGMASTDGEVRRKALDDYYGAAHHQGDVYPCTVASLPFLFALADDPTAGDRASVVGLLLSIGRESVGCDDGGIRFAPDGTISTACTDGAVMMRDRSAAFVAYAADADPPVRRAAIPGLGLFLDDADRAVDAVRSRLPAEPGTVERLLVIETMAGLALRLPAARTAATAWLRDLADDSSADPDIRLAALVHHARCVPDAVGEDTVPTAPAAPARPRDGDEHRREASQGRFGVLRVRPRSRNGGHPAADRRRVRRHGTAQPGPRPHHTPAAHFPQSAGRPPARAYGPAHRTAPQPGPCHPL